MSIFITLIAALIVFSAVIAIHEFGHFTVAKLCGIQVNEFSIGMGPVLWKKNHKGTQYSLRALPVGGFVALEGEESPESQQAEAAHTVQEQPAPETEASVQPTGVPLNEAPVWQRAWAQARRGRDLWPQAEEPQGRSPVSLWAADGPPSLAPLSLAAL